MWKNNKQIFQMWKSFTDMAAILRTVLWPGTVYVSDADLFTCCGILYKDHIIWIRPQKLGSSLDRCGHKRFPRLSVKYIRIIIHNIE